MAKYEIYVPAECKECNSSNVKILERDGIEFQCICLDCKHRFNYIMNL